VYLREDNIPTLIISIYAEPASEDIKLCDSLKEYKGVSSKESKNYDLIEGIYEEFEMLDRILKTGRNMKLGDKCL